MFGNINNLTKKYMILFSILMFANMSLAYADQISSQMQSDGNQINKVNDLLLIYGFVKLEVMDDCPDLNSQCVANKSKEMLDTFYQKKLENNIEFKATKIQTESMKTYVITASNNDTLSWLNFWVAPISKFEDTEIKIRRVSRLDDKHFWVEFEENYITSDDPSKLTYKTNWYANIVTFNGLNEMQYKARKIPIMNQTSYRSHTDGSADVYLEKHQINVMYSKGKIKGTKKTKKITTKQKAWLGMTTLKLPRRRR